MIKKCHLDKYAIRSFMPEDMEKIIGLLKESGWDAPYIEGQQRSLEKLLKDEEGDIFVVSHDNVILGFIQIQHHRWNRLSQIQGLGVAPGFRREGFGKKLIQHVECVVQNQGNRGIFLDTPIDNLGGRSFYKARGYSEAYIMPSYYKGGLDGVTYLKFF